MNQLIALEQKPRPDIEAGLRNMAEQLGYRDTCDRYLSAKNKTPYRPIDLAVSPVCEAWIAVLSIEGNLLHYARRSGLPEKVAASFFRRHRGLGIQKPPHWQPAGEGGNAAEA